MGNKKAQAQAAEDVQHLLSTLAELMARIDVMNVANLRLAGEVAQLQEQLQSRSVIAAQAVGIVNAEGRCVMTLGSDSDGNALIRMTDKHGLLGLVLQVDSAGGAVRLLDAAGELPVASLRVKQGCGELVLFDRDADSAKIISGAAGGQS